MAMKTEVLSDMGSCLNKEASDEPVFILRAQDVHAAYIVERWANLAEASAPKKAAEARKVAAAMRQWPKRKLPD